MTRTTTIPAAPIPPPSEALAGVPDHQGHPPAADAPPPIVPPPADVGPVLSADTVVRRSASTAGSAAALVVIGGLLIGLLVILTTDDAAGRRRFSPAATGWLIAAAVAVSVVVGLLAFRRRTGVSYVGGDGAAVYRGNAKGAVGQAKVLRFTDAAELFTGSTRHFTNGVYTGTTYQFRWADPAGRTLLKLKGTHKGRDGPPPAHDPYHFAHAAEVAWSTHLLARCQADLDRQKFIQFRVNGSDYVRVGHGVMEFHFGKRTERIGRDEVATIQLKGGAFHVTARDVKWFSRAGKFNFNYAKMANARVFLLAVERLVGLPFS